ncbi:hypothetical protein [Hydrogenophaga sp.]|uniref:hypothetical protein n=1 Tax=Hydrogenophaga sp. TaxID=1904254 RepID=UPI002730110F|nr:hypothetical protein [Hydrogenophaga sp.]MDP2015711.1 hypothetical protein [Hydrogenophaga sp.]MDP3164787.1 hypothetical protein [Hydrogenophaga sp.]
MQEVELTIERTLPIWWAFVWRALLVTVVTSVVVGAIGGFIVGVAGSPQLGGPVGAVLGFISAIVVSIWAMKSALSKTYGNHSMVLVKR